MVRNLGTGASPDHRRVATPGPVLRSGAEPRIHRVQGDIARDLQRMAIRFDQAGVVARPKDMPAPLVSLVEQLGMAAIEVLHAACQCRCLDADSEVVVRAEQAVRVALPTEAVHNGTEKLEPASAVGIVAKDLVGIGRVGSDVIQAVGNLDTRRTWHSSTVRRLPRRTRRQARAGAVSLQLDHPQGSGPSRLLEG